MCGIAGILHYGEMPDAAQRVRPMARAIRHRGPDDEGYWDDASIALGFVRLSILDIEGGRQPMTNETGDVQVVFNGEIYNHFELRRELEKAGHIFRSDHSDTEVLVHGWEEWGEALPERLNGMFAFAVWDARDETLFLARDRYGIKPLYVARVSNATILFASEIRGIHASGLVPIEEDADGLLEYFSQQNLWSERTVFRGVSEFPSGTSERVRRSGPVRRRYWDYRFERRSRLSLHEAAEAHRSILERVIARQIAADVPVMGYLSGGIDSSSLVSGAHRLDPKVRAYSCIFDLKGVGDDRIVDEREFARAVARHLRIEHIELELPQDALTRSLDATVRALETPRMGMSYVNYLIAQRVAQDSKVVLSGTGGDELHGGYVGRYQVVGAQAGRNLPWRAKLRQLISGRRAPEDCRRVYKDMLNFPVHRNQLSTLLTPSFLARATEYDADTAIERALNACPYSDPLDLVMYVDARTYLHGLLVLEDKLSMASSLEARVPLLDNELVDFVCTLPWDLLFDGQTGKRVFRESVRPWVPDAIYQKPKMGFGPPDASWYRGTLRAFVEAQLGTDRIEARGVFQPEAVRRCLDEHFSGRANHVALIWSLLSFESWCRVFGTLGGDLRKASSVHSPDAHTLPRSTRHQREHDTHDAVGSAVMGGTPRQV
jgi:asparagine synthase (glutamine-hydrolysing)